jgi:transposase
MWKSKQVVLTEKQEAKLRSVAKSSTSRSDHIQRAKIILLSAEGNSSRKIGNELGLSRVTTGLWRGRWLKNKELLLEWDKVESGIDYERKLLTILSDNQRPGTPGKFTSEQICQIINVACESPGDLNLPFSHWSLSSLADELVKRKIVESISTSQLGVFLKSSADKTA